MSKAILVMDMPSSCLRCDLCHNDCYYCTVSDAKCCAEKVPNDCPLKPMPKRINKTIVIRDYLKGRIEGYNACIDEILGGSEE